MDEKSHETRLPEMLNLLTVEYETDDVQLNLVQDYLNKGHAFQNYPATFAVATPQIYKLCEQRDISYRWELALRCGSHDPHDFWCLLGQPSIDEDCRAVVLRQSPERLMQLVAEMLPLCRVYNCSDEHIQGWRELLRVAVQLVAQKTYFWHCPFYSCKRVWKLRNGSFEVRSLEEVFHKWLRELELAGQDLLRYGELEHKAFRRSPSRLTIRLDFECHSGLSWSRKIINFSFGPQVEDWRFFISWPFDEWAGEFWHMVEDGFRPPMPGSWIKEEHGFGEYLKNAGRWFRSLATSRRKRRRYLRWTHMTEKEAEESLGSCWIGVIEDNRSRAGEGMGECDDELPEWAYPTG